jgi:hypothetical protein
LSPRLAARTESTRTTVNLAGRNGTGARSSVMPGCCGRVAAGWRAMRRRMACRFPGSGPRCPPRRGGSRLPGSGNRLAPVLAGSPAGSAAAALGSPAEAVSAAAWAVPPWPSPGTAAADSSEDPSRPRRPSSREAGAGVQSTAPSCPCGRAAGLAPRRPPPARDIAVTRRRPALTS